MRNVTILVAALAAMACSKGDPARAASPVEVSEPGAGSPAPPTARQMRSPLPAPGPTIYASGDDDFELQRTVDRGKRVYVRNLNGAVRVEGHSGDQVEIVAETHDRGGDPPADVRFQVVEHDGTFTLCALWPARDSECGPRGQYDHRDVRRNSTNVKMRVLVPSGVEIDVATVNGSTRVRDLDAAVFASSVNGKVRVETNDGPVEANSVNGEVDVKTGDGPVQARTVNGSIEVEIDKLSNPGPMELSTVNGSIDARLPDGFGAELEATVLNGSIQADMPMSRVKSMGKRHLHATIGDGGPRLEANTTNGSIRLRD